jgi:hypothetical protein
MNAIFAYALELFWNDMNKRLFMNFRLYSLLNIYTNNITTNVITSIVSKALLERNDNECDFMLRFTGSLDSFYATNEEFFFR